MANRVNRPGTTKMNPGRKAQAGAEIWPVDGEVEDLGVPTDYGDYPSGVDKPQSLAWPTEDPLKNNYVAPKKSTGNGQAGGW